MIRSHRQREGPGDEPRGSPCDSRPCVGSLALLLAWIFGGYLGIPSALLWVAAIGIVLTTLMTRTKFGRNTYLIGSNREAAVLAGMPLSAAALPRLPA